MYICVRSVWKMINTYMERIILDPYEVGINFCTHIRDTLCTYVSCSYCGDYTLHIAHVRLRCQFVRRVSLYRITCVVLNVSAFMYIL